METQKLVVMPEQKKNISVFGSVVVNKKDLIHSFDQIGWTDPVTGNVKAPLKVLNSLSVDKEIYPEESYDAEKPPACIFVPDIPTLTKMIETLAKTKNHKLLMSKYCDFKPPKPKWLLDAIEKKRKINENVDSSDESDSIEALDEMEEISEGDEK